ncbi:WhiB family transcriptional regulator [Gordonia sp. ABSL11-1]|jgi:WhiB family transcriptional regulator, redox-sensing transcriptional regulator|uniref:WhiB family transcriptional regulator n=1 Tax=Gordonia sp. ABSL11-1 TaxID=3053924 RepID=UPI0025734A60|nr:WhiB family transcriptional regulator [Gordonia sp. ABSL11-1]MDL9947858.1 WhiB family transcriptional regulator [Gordonia sp. ABSL11-1]
MTVECVLESCLSADRVSVERLDLPCQVADADLWFAEDPRDLERAKAMCAECPLREACLQAALERSEPWGVWGGEILERGAVIARKRPRGRPRKNAA